MDTFVYDDAISRKFLLATIVWGVVAFLVGVIIATELVVPSLNLSLPWITFGRLRPLHTNAAIFAFAGNSIFAATYYSSQRLLKTRMFSDLLSNIHFWGWQLIIVTAAITLPLGITQSKEYAELEWFADVAVVLVWVVFAINFFGTIAIRRERHLYVALWFYIATIVAIAVLYIFNNLSLPVTLTKSYGIYAGMQDAFMQWWYGHNAVAFFLTTPFLGLMYYFLPKAANRPVFSYKLSILHFWSLVFIYIWAGPHHLHYTSAPEWLSTLGMLFSLMLWMPSWGGMLNGLLTLRGAWNKVSEDPILKFYVVGVTFYGMSTFEGPMLSIKSVNALSHYTDWTIAHVHAGALGWNGMMTFGMAYWLMPRLFQAKLWSKKMMAMHFWIATIGILLYIIPIYAAGITQGLMWRAFDSNGNLVYTDFLETVLRLMPMYWIRVVGGLFFLTGGLMAATNLFMTWRARPSTYEEPIQQAAPLSKHYEEPPLPASDLDNVAGIARVLDTFSKARWHRRWERKGLVFTVWVAIAVISASLFEIIPTFIIKSNVPRIASVQPYTPLELAGRDIYVSEGCYNCHSQQIRPMRHEIERYGDYSKAGEFVYDHPFQWGSRRIGPDLARIGKTNTSVSWHVRHLRRPTDTSPRSIMPPYPWLLKDDLNFAAIPGKIKAMKKLGVPYSDEVVANCEEMAHEQAKQIIAKLAEENPGEYANSGLENKKIVAVVAYLLRLGTDIYAEAPSEEKNSGLAGITPGQTGK
ncbi:MAG TPA: cytochrome-c oxidase, cbb3-type subunit I [Phycisphaeraceae bacterium]|nr:cytochrome-c oxidase, cbb3-type subunit I [Phycisphaeraceae bacterium]